MHQLQRWTHREEWPQARCLRAQIDEQVIGELRCPQPGVAEEGGFALRVWAAFIGENNAQADIERSDAVVEAELV